MHRYKVAGEMHYAMATAPSLPPELSDIVLAVHNTHDFYPRPGARVAKFAPASLCPNGEAGVDCAQNDAGIGLEGIAPPDWTSIYDVNPLYEGGIIGPKIDGTGVTIVIVGTTQIAESDLAAFWARYGISRMNITTTVVPETGLPGAKGDGSGVEAVLDAEWAGSIAPGAAINLVSTGLEDENVTDAAYYAIEENLGGILSESFGGCEAQIPLSDADIASVFGSAANLLGITYLAAAGDSGAWACLPDEVVGVSVGFPASFPGITAVGGTGFAMPAGLTFDPMTNVAQGYGAESTWNEANDPNAGVAGGGGGISQVFARPDYQTPTKAPACALVGTNIPYGTDSFAGRQLPDVAFTAASGRTQYGIFIECSLEFSPSFETGFDCAAVPGTPFLMEIGGTSASTPAFAGVVALASQAAGGRLGDINPVLYALPSEVFHDVTTGNNEVICDLEGCPTDNPLWGFAATQGYDCATGLGSMDVTKYVTAVAGLTPTTTTLAAVASPLTKAAPISLQATVAVTEDGNTNDLTGTVAFGFQSYLADGTIDLSWTVAQSAISGGSPTGGTAAPAPVTIPPGMVNSGRGVDIVAIYGGDSTHLSSVSPKVHVAFTSESFCVSPGTSTGADASTITFMSSGGAAPVKWYVEFDTTSGSVVDETTGTLQLGSGPGSVVVAAIDADGAEAFAEVTLGSGGDPPGPGFVPDPCSSAGDGGASDGGDAGSVLDAGSATDAGNDDGGARADEARTPASGCNCAVGGRGGPEGGTGALVGALVGALALRTRRRR
jgi:MYXO-CTERM domain-containing protein